MSQTNYMNIAGWKIPVNTQEGVFPMLVLSIRKRINAKKAVNVAVTGEAGVGKSYFAIQLAMKLDPDFDIDKQVVFTYKEFLEAVIKLKMGKPIVFDEPSYAISKHDWYKQLNNALRKTIESFRYKVHPLIIPVINIDLLDKTVRSYLLQYHIILSDRGKGTAYRLNASQFESKTYRNTICKVNWGLYKTDCVKDSCLGCRKLDNCMEWCAVYERKKAEIQEQRYEESLNGVVEEEVAELTNEDIADIALKHANHIYALGKKYNERLRAVLELEENIMIGRNKANVILELLELKR